MCFYRYILYRSFLLNPDKSNETKTLLCLPKHFLFLDMYRFLNKPFNCGHRTNDKLRLHIIAEFGCSFISLNSLLLIRRRSSTVKVYIGSFHVCFKNVFLYPPLIALSILVFAFDSKLILVQTKQTNPIFD